MFRLTLFFVLFSMENTSIAAIGSSRKPREEKKSETNSTELPALSFNERGTIYAIINTPKMGTGTLQATFTQNSSMKCRPLPRRFGHLHACENDQKVIRTHNLHQAALEIREHRTDHPEGRCHVVTALRSPRHWFASWYAESALQRGSHCPIPREDALERYRKFASRSNLRIPFMALEQLLEEYGVDLASRFREMDSNGGYSLLGPAPEGSVVEGCELLLLRMEEAERWEGVLEGVFPGVRYVKSRSRAEMCPAGARALEVLRDYNFTREEKEVMVHHGGDFVKKWFDVYGYLN